MWSPRSWARRHPALTSAIIAGILFSIVFFNISAVARAQSPADSLTELTVDLWPDYDRPAVLVLLTGRLPADTPLPAEVTIPLPVNASLNAVARLTPEGTMLDDIDFTIDGGAVTLTTPDERFRIEYYAPYTTTDGKRVYRFAWDADALSVTQMAVTVQQPIVADALESTPAAITTSVGPDGLTYHHVPSTEVPARENYNVEFSYEASGNQLTASMLTEEPVQPELVPPSTPESTSESGVNWPLILTVAAGLLVVAAVVWQVVAGRRANKRGSRKSRSARSSRSSKPARSAQPAPPPKNSGNKAGVGFCHECGQPVHADDRFCRSCGTVLKGK